MVKITLRGTDVKEFETGTTIYEVAKSISESLSRAALGGIVDGEVKELTFTLDRDCDLDIITFEHEEGKKILRHTASHVLAQAVKRLYPNTKLAIGPAIDDGFYYDFDTEVNFTTEDLKAIESEMKKIVKERIRLERFTLPKAEAVKLLEDMDEPYKVELVNDLPEGEEISFYKQGVYFNK